MAAASPDDARVFVFVRLHAAAGSENDVRAALNDVLTASRLESGCVRMDAFRSIRDPRLFFIHSVWRDAEAFELHATLPHTVEFISTVDTLLDEPRQVARTRRMA
jgi:quinol monooxygenase YgiN